MYIDICIVPILNSAIFLNSAGILGWRISAMLKPHVEKRKTHRARAPSRSGGNRRPDAPPPDELPSSDTVDFALRVSPIFEAAISLSLRQARRLVAASTR